jgi:hypothetical protein
LEDLQSRADITRATLLNVGLQEQSLHMASFDLLRMFDPVEWECKRRSRKEPTLQRGEQTARCLWRGYDDAWRWKRDKEKRGGNPMDLTVIYTDRRAQCQRHIRLDPLPSMPTRNAFRN